MDVVILAILILVYICFNFLTYLFYFPFLFFNEQLRVFSAASLDSGTSDLCEISQNDNATKELFTIKTNEFTISVTTLDQNQTYNAKDIQTNEPIIENRRKTKNLKFYKKRRLDEDPRLKVCDICNRQGVLTILGEL